MLSYLNRKDWTWIAFNLMGVAFNIGWAVAFPENYFAFVNWFAAGVCVTSASFIPLMAQWRQVVEEQTATIIASTKALDAISPVEMQRMLQGGLLQVVEQMRKDGTLPPEVEVYGQKHLH